jgi:hypothetical protein
MKSRMKKENRDDSKILSPVFGKVPEKEMEEGEARNIQVKPTNPLPV